MIASMIRSLFANNKNRMIEIFMLFISIFLTTQANACMNNREYPTQCMKKSYPGCCYHQHCHHCHHRHACYDHRYDCAYVPIAICSTIAVHAPLPTYECCKLRNQQDGYSKNGYDKDGYAWRNTWVSGGCRNADPRATGDMGCDMNSPTYSTGKPIVGDCQFYTDDKYPQCHSSAW